MSMHRFLPLAALALSACAEPPPPSITPAIVDGKALIVGSAIPGNLAGQLAGTQGIGVETRFAGDGAGVRNFCGAVGTGAPDIAALTKPADQADLAMCTANKVLFQTREVAGMTFMFRQKSLEASPELQAIVDGI